MTNITITGNTVAPAELRFTPQGIAAASFTVAVNERKKTQDGWADDGATFYRVTVWREYAEAVAEALGEKGMRVVVAGKVRTRDYERRDGGKGISLEVTADDVAISIPRQRRQPQQADSWSSQQQQKPAADPWATPGEEAPF